MAARIPHHRLLRLLAAGQKRAPCASPHIHQPSRSLSSFTPRRFSTAPIRRQTQQTQPAEPLPPAPTAPPTTPPTTPPRKSRFRTGRLISGAVFLLLGTIAGSSLRLLIQPPTPPEPGTETDRFTISVLHSQAERLPIVQQLSSDPSWTSWDAYDTLTPSHRKQHIMAGTLAGSRGVGGYQRIFYNAGTGEFVSVIYFGAATTGWPGVVHGGALATLIDESCGRAAFWQWGGKSGVTASLGLEYKRATLSQGFYVLRVRAKGEEELPEKERGKRHYKCFVDAALEDAATGKVTVMGEALFVGGLGKKARGDVMPLPTAEENMRF